MDRIRPGAKRPQVRSTRPYVSRTKQLSPIPHVVNFHLHINPATTHPVSHETTHQNLQTAVTNTIRLASFAGLDIWPEVVDAGIDSIETVGLWHEMCRDGYRRAPIDPSAKPTRDV